MAHIRHHFVGSLEQILNSSAVENYKKGMLFHQDNAHVHKSVIAMAAINDNGLELIEHLPYSLHLAPSDFHLVTKLKSNFWYPLLVR